MIVFSYYLLHGAHFSKRIPWAKSYCWYLILRNPIYLIFQLLFSVSRKAFRQRATNQSHFIRSINTWLSTPASVSQPQRLENKLCPAAFVMISQKPRRDTELCLSSGDNKGRPLHRQSVKFLPKCFLCSQFPCSESCQSCESCESGSVFITRQRRFLSLPKSASIWAEMSGI